MAMLEILLALVTIVIAVILYLSRKPQVFRRLGIPGPEPVRLLGELKQYKEKGVAQYDLELLKKYGNKVGIHVGRRPQMLVTDPAIIEEVFVKQFTNFPNRPGVMDYGCPMRNAIALAPYEDWKHLRSSLLHLFSSSKLQRVMPVLSECVDDFVKKIDEKTINTQTFDIYELCSNFSLDCLLSLIFGPAMYSCKKRDQDLAQHCLQAWRAGNETIIRHAALCTVAPVLKNAYKCTRYNILPPDLRKYFYDLIRGEIERRQSSQIKSDDFLQWMIDRQHTEEVNGNCNNNKSFTSKGLSEEDIVGNCVFFVMAGYDTVANLLGFILHSLAASPASQDKLYSEIENNASEDAVSVDSLVKLRYLDNVVKETLRMYPPFLRINRTASRDVNINGVNIPTGTEVHVPIYALHRDADLWSSPDLFDPDRFSKTIVDYSYLPFGTGPRDCFPKSLVFIQAKLAVVKILQSYKLTAPVQGPLELAKSGFCKSAEGYNITFEART